MKRIHAIALATAAAFAAPVFADTVTYYLWDPVQRTYVERTVDQGTVLPADTVTYVEPAPPSATYTYTDTATTYRGPDIVVVEPRTEDELITEEVVDRIAANPYIEGRVGVETFRNEVTLTGRVGTSGHANQAEREAMSVDGVREVHNLMRRSSGRS